MPALFQFPFVFGVPVLPASRVIAIDAGSQHLKVVLAERFLSRERILRRECLEAPKPGASPAEAAEANAKLAALIKEWGAYPVALTLPQHVTISQVIDLPPVEGDAVARLVQNEAYKLAGLSQSKVSFDHAPLEPFGRHQHAYWITLCQENEVNALVERLGLARADLCDATSAGNALIAAYLALFPDTSATVVVDLGLRSTTVAILYEGQGVHVAAFALGNEMFLETIGSARRCSLDEAARLQLESDLFGGPEALPAVCALAGSWRQELFRIVQEWLDEQPQLRLQTDSFQFVLTGEAAASPGFISYLNRSSGVPVFGPWPEPAVAGRPPGWYAVAEGAARQALGKSAQPASLLPMDLRGIWKKQHAAQILQSVTFFFLLATAALLGLGFWQKVSLENRKQELQAQANSALQRARRIESLQRQFQADYHRLHPLLERQQATLDTLQALAALQETRSNRSFWYVLFADQQSYFGSSTLQTNEPPPTNVVGLIGPLPLEPPVPTNRITRAGFIAELCIPEEGEAMRRTRSQLVTALKQNPRFKNVDTMPAEQRRPLAEPKVLLPNPERHVALFLELATNEFLVAAAPATNVTVTTPSPRSGLPIGRPAGKSENPP